MKNKTWIVIIIAILAIIALPSTLAQLQASETNYIVNDTPKSNTVCGFTQVVFCCGQISNLNQYNLGYGEWYTFDAENVICIVSFQDHPLFHRFFNGEKLGMLNPIGIITNNYVVAFL